MDITESPFRSFFMGGFECSTHRRADGLRLDLIAATQHDSLAEQDYRILRDLGIATVRDGLRWHLIEKRPGSYDWSSFLPLLHASKRAGMQVIWDLCHYGWPDDLDIWSPAFGDRFADFSRAAAEIVSRECPEPALFCVINEISYWAWAGGEVALMNPGARARAGELKRRLVKASLQAMAAIREVDPRIRFISAEPVINVTSFSDDPVERRAAREFHLAQYEANDFMCGRLEPELGGDHCCLDIVGVNYYPDNQWILNGSVIPLGHCAYRPFGDLLVDVYKRYRRPLVVTETGAEGSARPSWLHYVCDEVRRVMARGVPVLGICLYPIVDYPGWANGRCCETGLLGVADRTRKRRIHVPLLMELARQGHLMSNAMCSVESAYDGYGRVEYEI